MNSSAFDIAEKQYKQKSNIATEVSKSKNAFDIAEEQFKKPKSYLRDISEQGIKGSLEGALGTYGDLFDLLGLQSKEMLPGEKSQYDLESQASPEQLPHLVDSSDVLPRYSRAPNSQDIGEFIEKSGGPGEAETGSGRYANRIARLTSSGTALGSKLLKAPIIAGAVGQTLAELGAPGWAQAAGELAAFLKSTPKLKGNISSGSPEIKDKLAKLKKLGYSDQDLTLAKSALEDKGFLKKASKLTSDSEKRFKETLTNAENNVQDILKKGFPGLDEGLGNIKNASSELYASVDELAKNVSITKPEIFIENAQKTIEKLKNSLANTPQEKQVIELLEKAIESSKGSPTADSYINFYQGLNQLGNWGSPKQREHVFSTVKDAIKQTFKKQGPEGQKLANTFDEANNSWKRFRLAEDVTNVIEKASTEEGLNFTKLSKSLDNPDTLKTFIDGLGKEQAHNLKLISKTSSQIKDLEKVMKGGLGKEALGIGKAFSLSKALLTGDFAALKGIVGAETAGRISTRLLTDPKYQSMQLKLIDKFKSGHYNQIPLLIERMTSL